MARIKTSAAYILVVIMSGWLYSPLKAQVQEHEIRGSGEIGLGLGLGRAKFSAGPYDHIEISVPFHVHIGSRGFNFTVELDPIHLQNPRQDEEFRAITFLFSFKLFKHKKFFIQPGAGFQYRNWYGLQKDDNINFGFAYRLGIGYRYETSPKFSFQPEFFYRRSIISSDNEKSTSMMGILFLGAWNF
ncbi:MAG: hypothetical protein JSW33_01105 [bacterium]|nr:MAG: hypothetical protein JSW33_01105 [bacterium]